MHSDRIILSCIKEPTTDLVENQFMLLISEAEKPHVLFK